MGRAPTSIQVSSCWSHSLSVPDLETAYTGEWSDGRMVRGRASRVVGGGLLDGVLRLD